MRKPAILVVESDWRTRRFICTLLKYEIGALVFEASSPPAALSMAKAADTPIDLLISNTELADVKSGTDLARELADLNPAMNVLLLSLRGGRPSDTSPAWRFLPIPFLTDTLLAWVRELSVPTGAAAASCQRQG